MSHAIASVAFFCCDSPRSPLPVRSLFPPPFI
jgi:hypothetical protein